MVCFNCALCFRCARSGPKTGLPVKPPFTHANCGCGHQVVPYDSKEWRVRFRAANPTAELVGRMPQGTLVARFPGIAHLVRLVGGTPEHPTCIKA